MDGVIFDIKEGAVYDGPGLRQTVFLKGCPLRCAWCHNPEGLSGKPELMVSPNGCTGCGACKAVCEHEPCIACGKCVSQCGQRLRRVVGERISPERLADRLNKDAPYYRMVGGGITFSGGEPLLQAGFVLETAALLAPGLHKAIETSGYAPADDFERVVRAMDLIMMDLKVMDDSIHQRYTGVSNRRILDNARLLSESGKPFLIRVPLIPTVNDNAENFRKTAEFLQGFQNLLRVELLPYHATAGAKYAMLGKTYQADFPQNRAVYDDTRIFAEYGIRSCVL